MGLRPRAGPELHARAEGMALSAAWNQRVEREAKEAERQRARAEERERPGLPPEPEKDRKRQREGPKFLSVEDHKCAICAHLVLAFSARFAYIIRAADEGSDLREEFPSMANALKATAALIVLVSRVATPPLSPAGSRPRSWLRTRVKAQPMTWSPPPLGADRRSNKETPLWNSVTRTKSRLMASTRQSLTSLPA